MEDIHQLHRVTIREGNVGEAIVMIDNYIANHPQLVPAELIRRLENIKSDYKLMLDFMLMGYRDSKRNEVYYMLFHKLLTLIADFEHAAIEREKLAFQSLTTRKSGIIDERDTVTFNNVLLSYQWTNADRCFYTEYLLSPTIDVDAACILISSVMLSAMTVADIQKTLTLRDVYAHAEDERLRQRALVGLAFSLLEPEMLNGYLEYHQLLEGLCNDDSFRRELLELQEQVFLCMDADRDNEIIQRDILPTLLKNQQFRITRFGIEEIEEDSLQNILNPHAEEEAMEELEQSMIRMMDMQKEGADIYFGGFSRMKTFSFFYTMSNWFAPFSINHPMLSQIRNKLQNNRFLELLFDNGPLCDSDKYSFALAMSSILNSLPDNIREMMNSEEALGQTVSEESKQSPAYVRRMYLQDLYRFFRLYNRKDDFRSPFSSSPFPIFVHPSSPTTHHPLNSEALQLGRFLLKRKRYDTLNELIDARYFSEDSQWALLKGLVKLKGGDYNEAQRQFQIVLNVEADNERAIKGLAQSGFLAGNYDVASIQYKRLQFMHPESNHYQVNFFLSNINAGNVEETLPELYRYHYDHPDDLQARRILAWGLLMQQQLPQAERHYQLLIDSDHALPADHLNLGYCYWMQGNIQSAVDSFQRYLSESGEENAHSCLLDDFHADNILFERSQIDSVEQMLMVNLVTSKKKSS